MSGGGTNGGAAAGSGVGGREAGVDAASGTGAPDVPALPERVGVLGGGTMGAGIAHAMLVAGAHVTIADADAERSAAARVRVVDAVAATQERGKLVEAVEDVVARLDAGVGAAAWPARVWSWRPSRRRRR